MQLNEKHAVMRAVLENTGVESSSDFVVALYQIFRRTDPEMTLLIDPIYRWEYMNFHDDWGLNIKFIEDKLDNLDDGDYTEVDESYKFVLTMLLEHPILSSVYKLDEKDPIGWKIYRELQEKRESVRKARIVAAYEWKLKNANN